MSEISLTSEIAVQLIDKMGGDASVARAAWVSTGQDQREAEPGRVAGLIRYLVKQKHGTPLECSSMTFRVHAPIFVWREWHRHRIGFSYSESSARYADMEPIFWVPRPDRKLVPAPGSKSARPTFVCGTAQQHRVAYMDLANAYRSSWDAYRKLLNDGIAREVARACLPVAIYSTCYVTCNPRSMMAFLSLRTHDPEARFVSYPQAEIEEAARACEAIFAEGWPETYAAFVECGRVAP